MPICATYMYNVHCTMYIVQCTLYNVHCTMYIVQCTLYTIHCTLYIVHIHIFHSSLFYFITKKNNNFILNFCYNFVHMTFQILNCITRYDKLESRYLNSTFYNMSNKSNIIFYSFFYLLYMIITI